MLQPEYLISVIVEESFANNLMVKLLKIGGKLDISYNQSF